MFEFFEKLRAPSSQDESVVLAGESIPSPTGVRVENSESAKAVSEAAKRGSGQAESGNRTFSFESGNPAKDAKPVTGAPDPAMLQALNDILDPKVWKGAMGAPGDAMHAITGKAYWELSSEEKETLAKTGAAAARCLMITDPKWLALSLFAGSVLAIYGPRALKDLQERKAALQNPAPNAA